MVNPDNPMIYDEVHQLLKGMVDELIAFKEYRVRNLMVNDAEVSETYEHIMYEEIEHFGEFLAQILRLDPKFKENLLKGMLKHSKSAASEIENGGEIDADL